MICVTSIENSWNYINVSLTTLQPILCNCTIALNDKISKIEKSPAVICIITLFKQMTFCPPKQSVLPSTVLLYHSLYFFHETIELRNSGKEFRIME